MAYWGVLKIFVLTSLIIVIYIQIARGDVNDIPANPPGYDRDRSDQALSDPIKHPDTLEELQDQQAAQKAKQPQDHTAKVQQDFAISVEQHTEKAPPDESI